MHSATLRALNLIGGLMKKLLSSLLLASFLFTAMPAKKAEAAWGIGMAAGVVGLVNQNIGNDNSTIALASGITFGAAWIAGMTGFIIAAATGSSVGTWVILDENTDRLGAFAESITIKYPFIENPAVIAEFSNAINEKFIAANAKEAKVSLSEAELSKILAPADLTEEEMAEVVSDLK